MPLQNGFVPLPSREKFLTEQTIYLRYFLSEVCHHRHISTPVSIYSKRVWGQEFSGYPNVDLVNRVR